MCDDAATLARDMKAEQGRQRVPARQAQSERLTMHMPGWLPLLIVLGLAFLLFGRPGRLSGLMEDFGKGIRGFRKGMDDGANPPPAQDPPRQLRDQSPAGEETRTRTDDRTGA